MSWLGRLFRTRRMERELDSELRFHFESQVADKIAGGLPEAEARRATRLEFGGLAQVKEDCRESRGTLWVASIGQDLRFGARMLMRSPGFALTSILVLALGIGVSTLAFSLYNLIALQLIPVRDPGTLVNVERRSPENITPVVPYTSIVYFRDNARTLSAVMATMNSEPMVLDKDEQRVKPSFVSSNYFTELGEPAALGRLFDPAVETTGSNPVVVLSNRFWQRRFNGDVSVVGRVIHLGGKPATVIGVASATFANLGTDDPDLWLPLLQHSYFVDGSKALTDPQFEGGLRMWGRLAPGVTASQAAQELLALTNQMRKLYPDVIWENEYVVITPGGHFSQMRDGPSVLALVSVLVLLILAVACANLGGLLMARGVGRRREIQLRFDLGARKSRVFRQLLTESLLLGMLGSLAALPLSYAVLRAALVYADAPKWMSAVPDWRVAAFTAMMGFVAAMFFGMLPTFQMVRQKKSSALWHQFVVCAQVGASCVLLIVSGLLVRATLHTLYTDPGFGYQRVLALNPGLGDHGYTPAAAQSYLGQLQERIRTVPGVTSVSTALLPPLVTNGTSIIGINIDGRQIKTYPNWVGADFFQTMGIPLLRGRVLRAGETHAVVISQSLARKRWPTEDPIGKEWTGKGKEIVVGIVGNTRAMELNNSDATEIYYPAAAKNFPGMSIMIKTTGEPDSVIPTIKSIAADIDPKLFPTVTPLKVGFMKSIGQVEQIATIISMLGGIAIFLAVVGLLGLVMYAVSQRTKEIAIRLAVGAGRVEIFSVVLRRFAWPVVTGLVLGIGMAAAASQVLRRGLYGLSGLDPISYASAIALLVAILAVAALLPIRRAFRIDVARILHAE